MVEIYKVIACIPLLNRTIDDKKKWQRKGGAVIIKYNIYAGILNLLAFVSVFLMITIRFNMQ